jgi:hypothetical protein
MPGVLKHVIGSMLEREFENGKGLAYRRLIIKKKNVWGECQVSNFI